MQLVDQLTKIVQIIDTQPSVQQTCEKAKFIVANAPLGTVAAGKQVLISAIEQLEMVEEKEPQIRMPLRRLKPLAQAYMEGGPKD